MSDNIKIQNKSIIMNVYLHVFIISLYTYSHSYINIYIYIYIYVCIYIFKFSFNMIDSSKLNIGGNICLPLRENKKNGIDVNT